MEMSRNITKTDIYLKIPHAIFKWKYVYIISSMGDLIRLIKRMDHPIYLLHDQYYWIINILLIYIILKNIDHYHHIIILKNIFII